MRSRQLYDGQSDVRLPLSQGSEVSSTDSANRSRTAETAVRLEAEPLATIDRVTRLMGWSHKAAIDRLPFWTASNREISLGQMAAESDIRDPDQIYTHVQSQWDVYVANVTTPDVAQTGFHVVRVIAPAAQPLYLRETNRYWDEQRLSTVRATRGYDTTPSTEVEINEYPHPFP